MHHNDKESWPYSDVFRVDSRRLVPIAARAQPRSRKRHTDTDTHRFARAPPRTVASSPAISSTGRAEHRDGPRAGTRAQNRQAEKPASNKRGVARISAR